MQNSSDVKRIPLSGLLVGTVLTLFFFGCTENNIAIRESPNIILIVADDLGYSDLRTYGGEIKTPSLDSMANEGLRLSNMHNAGMCVISRSSLLTGK